jgi:hypothetical protein
MTYGVVAVVFHNVIHACVENFRGTPSAEQGTTRTPTPKKESRQKGGSGMHCQKLASHFFQ